MHDIHLFLLILRSKAKKNPTKGQNLSNKELSGMVFANTKIGNSKNFK